jgi:hypothetical protein
MILRFRGAACVADEEKQQVTVRERPAALSQALFMRPEFPGHLFSDGKLSVLPYAPS